MLQGGLDCLILSEEEVDGGINGSPSTGLDPQQTSLVPLKANVAVYYLQNKVVSMNGSYILCVLEPLQIYPNDF